MIAFRREGAFYCVKQGGTAGIILSLYSNFLYYARTGFLFVFAKKESEENTMKRNKTAKLLTVLLSVLLCAALSIGCSSVDSTAAQSTVPAQSESAEQTVSQQTAAASQSADDDKVYKIGIIQLAENGAFTDMREGFIAKLAELGYGEGKVEYDYKNAQGDVGTLNTICQEVASSDCDIAVTIATPAAQAYVSQESEIPLIFISVSDPVAAGILSSMDTPDRNATGSSNLVPVDEIFEVAEKLTPDVKNYGILYNTGEANAVNTVASAKKYLDGNGYTYTEATVTNTSEVQQAAEALAEKCDAIFIPIDSSVQAAMTQVTSIATEAGIPVYGSSPVMVQDGALATVSTDDTQVGALAAELAAEYFSGTPISDIPAQAVSEFIIVVNSVTAEALNIEIPQDILNVGAQGAVVIG